MIYLASEWVIRVAMLIYVPQKRSAAASRTWLLLIFLLPWPGLVLYALFGRIYVPHKRIAQQERASKHIRAIQPRIPARIPPAPTLATTAALAARLGDFETFGGNRIELLTDYNGSIKRLIEDIDAASHHVHLLFYIFEDDETGHRVAASLIRAIQRGVNCRVLMDAVGSKRGLKRLAPELRAAGVEVNVMLPVGLFRSNAARFDLRNHRKIAVVDGCIGYTGSQNIVNPGFVKGYPNEELVARVTGPVVAQLQAVFLADHYFETNAALDESELFPVQKPAGRSAAQVVPSGPGYQRENGQELIVALLYSAQKRVVITTPYFVPDEPFLQAIRTAALRNVEIHLVVSHHANQRITQLAQRSYYEALLEADVQVHLYQPHFLHAKHLSIDDDVVFLGSTNIDIRSFALNSEINLLIYDSEVAASLRAVQERYFANSTRLRQDEWNRRPLASKVIENTARLADSLL
jgi:cardiolipin synthase